MRPHATLDYRLQVLERLAVADHSPRGQAPCHLSLVHLRPDTGTHQTQTHIPRYDPRSPAFTTTVVTCTPDRTLFLKQHDRIHFRLPQNGFAF